MELLLSKPALALSMGFLGVGALSPFASFKAYEFDFSLPKAGRSQDIQFAHQNHINRDELIKAVDNGDEATTRRYELEDVAPITLIEAIQTAEAFAGGLATEAELEWKYDFFTYSVEIGTQEIVIDASTGEIMFTEAEDDDEPDVQSLGLIPIQQAVQTAESLANARAYSAELEEENSALVYVVEVGNQEFHIDPSNGDVLHVEVEGQR